MRSARGDKPMIGNQLDVCTCSPSVLRLCHPCYVKGILVSTDGKAGARMNAA